MDLAPVNSFEEYKALTHIAAEDYNGGKMEDALEKFLHLEKYNETNPKVHETLAHIYVKLNKPDQAALHYQRYMQLMLEKHPNLKKPPTFEETVAKILSSKGSLEVLEKEYEEALEEEAAESFSIVPLQLSLVYMSKGEFSKAEQIAQEYKKKVESARGKNKP